MADQLEVSAASEELLLGTGVGLEVKANVIEASRESLVGDYLARDVPANVIAVSRDALVGDLLGRDVFANAIHSIRETLISEAGFHGYHAVRESLVSIIESVETQHYVGMAIESAAQRKVLQIPSTGVSPVFVGVNVQLTIQDKPLAVLTSSTYYGELSLEAALKRTMTAAGDIRSSINVPQTTSMAVLLRELPTGYVSPEMVQTVREMAVRDTTMPVHIGIVQVGKYVEQVIRKVIIGFPITGWAFAAARQQAVRSVVILNQLGPALVGSTYTEVARASVNPKPVSNLIVGKMLLQSAIGRTPVPPVSPISVGKVLNLSAVMREVDDPSLMGAGYLGSLRQQLALGRDLGIWISNTRVGKVSVEYAQRRTTIPPIDVIDPSVGRHYGSIARLSTHRRATEPPGPPAYIVQYGEHRNLTTQGRVTVPPVDVIDPTVGVMFGSEAQLAVIARTAAGAEPRLVMTLGGVVTLGDSLFQDPTAVLSYSLVTAVGSDTILGDTTFGDPAATVSPVNSFAVGSVVSLGDGEFIDPTIPHSLAAVNQFGQVAVVIDPGFIDPSIPQSVARTSQVGQVTAVGDGEWVDPTVPQSFAAVNQFGWYVVLGDSLLPDPIIPQSDVRTSQVAQVSALGDVFPDPTLPTSDVNVTSLTSHVALRDYLIDGYFPMEPVDVSSVGEVLVMRDTAMLRIPARSDRRRPTVVVQIT